MSSARLLSSELEKRPVQDLERERDFLKKELFNLRFQKALGELKNHSRFSAVKRSVARINTELSKRVKLGEY